MAGISVDGVSRFGVNDHALGLRVGQSGKHHRRQYDGLSGNTDQTVIHIAQPSLLRIPQIA
jgi:hypothetical protein